MGLCIDLQEIFLTAIYGQRYAFKATTVHKKGKEINT